MKRNVGLLLTSLAVLLITIVLPGNAAADWKFEFSEMGYPIDQVDAFMVTPGMDFASPGFSDLNHWGDGAAGWTGSQSPGHISASGGLISDLVFFINFLDTTNPFAFDFYAYNTGTVIDATRVSWDTSEFHFGAIPDPPNPVPEPGTMALLASGLIGLAGYGRKRFEK